MAKKDSDAELKVAGVPVARSQFNCIFLEIDKLLKEAERTSGIKVKWDNVTPLVFISGSLYDGHYYSGYADYFTSVISGYYRGDTWVSAACAGVGIQTHPCNNHDLQVAVKCLYDPIGVYDQITQDEVTMGGYAT